MNHVAVIFANFGPYHLARLRGLAERLKLDGIGLVAIEVAGTDRQWPWRVGRDREPFDWITLFPDRELNALSKSECDQAIRACLDEHAPAAVAATGYVRPESSAAASWARRRRVPSILMSESQRVDRPKVWWKESVKALRVRRFDAALVGGPSHADYLVDLGMPRDRIFLGYNAVDHDGFARQTDSARRDPATRGGLPDRPYFLSVSRFAAEKNLPRLIRAFATYRAAGGAWDLALVGGGPDAGIVEGCIADSGLGGSIYRPGFLHGHELACWYAHASAFVLASVSEPWGLVVNEAAAAGLPLLVSDRAGVAGTLVEIGTGRTFDPTDEAGITRALGWVAGLGESKRAAIGARAREVAADWGPGRLASGFVGAMESARRRVAAHRGLSRSVG